MANKSSSAVHLLSTPGATFNCKEVKKPKPRPVVYFVLASTGQIKIGSTKNMDLRMFGLQCGSPVALELLATIKGDRNTEFAYHKRFAEARLHGEWFAPHPDLLAEIDRLKSISGQLGVK